MKTNAKAIRAGNWIKRRGQLRFVLGAMPIGERIDITLAPDARHPFILVAVYHAQDIVEAFAKCAVCKDGCEACKLTTWANGDRP